MHWLFHKKIKIKENFVAKTLAWFLSTIWANPVAFKFYNIFLQINAHSLLNLVNNS